MVKFYYDSQTKKIIDYIETTFEVATAEERPPEPAQVVGKKNVDYYNPETGKIEWRQEDRPLNVEEQLASLKQEQETNAQAIQELALAGMGGV